MIDLVVFDMAGTTVTDKDFVARTFQKAFWMHDIKISVAHLNPLMGYPKPFAIQMVLENLNIAIENKIVEDIYQDFVQEMKNFYNHSPYVQPIAGTEELFYYLKEKGIRIALNTGFSNDIARVIVQRFRWIERGLINDFIASDEVKQGRPYADMIQELKKRMEIRDGGVIMKVGDTVVDILEGINAGCQFVVAVTSGSATRTELEACNPTHIVDSLSEIPAILNESVKAYV